MKLNGDVTVMKIESYKDKTEFYTKGLLAAVRVAGSPDLPADRRVSFRLPRRRG